MTRSISEKINGTVLSQGCNGQFLVCIKQPCLDIWKKSLLNDQYYLFFFNSRSLEQPVLIIETLTCWLSIECCFLFCRLFYSAKIHAMTVWFRFSKKMYFFVILGLKINPASSSLKIWQFENNDFICTANQMFIFEWQ